jgi:hypothetical protein
MNFRQVDESIIFNEYQAFNIKIMEKRFLTDNQLG